MPDVRQARTDAGSSPRSVVVNGLAIHVVEADGAGPPAILEAGLVGTSATWSLVQAALASCGVTSYAYDRRGLGGSVDLETRPSLDSMVADLRSVVEALPASQPAVLVAHSFGALIASTYARRYPADVIGLVLVDPLVPDEWLTPSLAARWRLRRTAFLSSLCVWLAHAGVVRLGLWALLRRGPGNAGPVLGLSATMRRLAGEVAKIPPDVQGTLREQWCEPRFFRTLRATARALPAVAAKAAGERTPPCARVTVLSGAHEPPDVVARHRSMATCHQVVPETGHWIPFDRPDFVAESVCALADPGFTA